MRIAICDDDRKYNENLHGMLKDYLHRNKIDKCKIDKYNSGVDLLKEYRNGIFEIIFLDVEMPLFDGFETAKKIREMDLDIDIIFVTYLSDHVQRGYDYNAKGYLSKGVTQQQIDEIMDKLISERLRNKNNAYYRVKLKNGGSVMLSLQRVLYFESNSHTISAVFENETNVFIGSLINLEQALRDKGFIRVNQSYLVNIKHVFIVSGNKVTIKKGKDIKVGRKYKKSLIDELIGEEAIRWRA
ncbi:MAG: LytTR family DNA-binding domain-containing protein [Defluviitaleaceae bacterium]|nr:LytTR family DNA-binding domain-containing protein [Defluviitaleaceae bacterium]